MNHHGLPAVNRDLTDLFSNLVRLTILCEWLHYEIDQALSLPALVRRNGARLYALSA